MKIKWKKVPGSTMKYGTTQFNFTYTPPTETEQKISKIERVINTLKPLRIYLEGMRAAGGLSHDLLSYETPKVLKEVIEVNEQRLLELKDQDRAEKAKPVKKKK